MQKSKYHKVTIAVGPADYIGSALIERLSNDVQQMVLQAKTLIPQGDVHVDQ